MPVNHCPYVVTAILLLFAAPDSSVDGMRFDLALSGQKAAKERRAAFAAIADITAEQGDSSEAGG